MITYHFNDFQNISLGDMAAQLHREYYAPLTLFCQHTADHISGIAIYGLPAATVNFLQLSADWILDVNELLTHRREVIIPYIQELTEKEANGHNCVHCSGRCEIQHKTKIIELNLSLAKISDQYASYLDQINKFPYLHEKEAFRFITTTQLFLSEYLVQLIAAERQYLIPGIEAAQKKINAYS